MPLCTVQAWNTWLQLVGERTLRSVYRLLRKPTYPLAWPSLSDLLHPDPHDGLMATSSPKYEPSAPWRTSSSVRSSLLPPKMTYPVAPITMFDLLHTGYFHASLQFYGSKVEISSSWRTCFHVAFLAVVYLPLVRRDTKFLPQVKLHRTP